MSDVSESDADILYQASVEKEDDAKGKNVDHEGRDEGEVSMAWFGRNVEYSKTWNWWYFLRPFSW